MLKTKITLENYKLVIPDVEKRVNGLDKYFMEIFSSNETTSSKSYSSFRIVVVPLEDQNSKTPFIFHYLQRKQNGIFYRSDRYFRRKEPIS